MGLRRGISPILLIIAVVLFAVGGAAGAALVGQAPKCPSAADASRGEKEIGDLLEKSGSVTVNDSEATAIAQKYVAGKVGNTRVCFTSGLANASGNIKVGPLTPSFYASAGIDLSASTPKATNLNIKVGALPNMPVVTAQVEKIVTDLINENLAKIILKKKYSVDFSTGSTTVNKLSK